VCDKVLETHLSTPTSTVVLVSVRHSLSLQVTAILQHRGQRPTARAPAGGRFAPRVSLECHLRMRPLAPYVRFVPAD
jgi:hypothetical protein